MRGHCIKNWVLNGWLPTESDNWLEFFLFTVIVESIQETLIPIRSAVAQSTLHLDIPNDTWNGTELDGQPRIVFRKIPWAPGPSYMQIERDWAPIRGL